MCASTSISPACSSGNADLLLICGCRARKKGRAPRPPARTTDDASSDLARGGWAGAPLLPPPPPPPRCSWRINKWFDVCVTFVEYINSKRERQPLSGPCCYYVICSAGVCAGRLTAQFSYCSQIDRWWEKERGGVSLRKMYVLAVIFCCSWIFSNKIIWLLTPYNFFQVE
jgi:hypothetical protein